MSVCSVISYKWIKDTGIGDNGIGSTGNQGWVIMHARHQALLC